MTGEDCIIVMPNDVHPRCEGLLAFENMGVRVFSESSFVQMLSGCPAVYLPAAGWCDASRVDIPAFEKDLNSEKSIVLGSVRDWGLSLRGLQCPWVATPPLKSYADAFFCFPLFHRNDGMCGLKRLSIAPAR